MKPVIIIAIAFVLLIPINAFAATEHVVYIMPGSSVPGCEETNRCFSPTSVIVEVGDHVIFKNNDTAMHAMQPGTAELGIGDWNLGGPYNEKGNFAFFDMVHPWMKGVVIVGINETVKQENPITDLKNVQETKRLANIATELSIKVTQAENELRSAESEVTQYGPTYAKLTKLAERDPTNADKVEKSEEAIRKMDFLHDEKKKKYELAIKLKLDWENARKDAKIVANNVISIEETKRTEKEIQRLIDAKAIARDAWFETRDALIQAAEDSRAEYKRIFDSVKYDDGVNADNIARNTESVAAARNEVIREAGIAQKEAEIAIRLAAESLLEKTRIYDSTTEYGREFQKGQIESVADLRTVAMDAYELAEYGKTLIKSGSYDEQTYRNVREKTLLAESKIERNERSLLEVDNIIQKELCSIIKCPTPLEEENLIQKEPSSEIKEELDPIRTHISPKKQVKSGIAKNDVTCSENLVLIEKPNGSSIACVKITTAERLEVRGWKIIP